jgi:hypothetical protein
MAEDNGMADTSDYKAKLDELASRAKSPPKVEGKTTSIVEKGTLSRTSINIRTGSNGPLVSEYIPVVGRVLGNNEPAKHEPTPAGDQIPGPPHRPIHDKQIEEFIKEQHHSKKVIEIEKESTED